MPRPGITWIIFYLSLKLLKSIHVIAFRIITSNLKYEFTPERNFFAKKPA